MSRIRLHMVGASLSAQATSELVGRDDELGTLSRARDRAAAGRFTVVLISGEAGTGKTRLATEFLDRQGRGAIELVGRGHPFGASTSFGLWVEALDRYLHRLRSSETIAPSLLTPHRRLMVSVTQVLQQLSIGKLVITVLDDIHLADGSSWELLDYLAAPLRDCSILVVVCARDTELPARAKQALASLEQRGALQRLPLSAFGRTQTRLLAAALINRDPPETLVDWLVDHADGNPLFITVLIEDLIERGVNVAAPGPLHPPVAIREQVAARAANLRPRARSTLDILAIARKRVPFGLLLEVEGRRDASVIADLQELVGAHLVAEDMSNGEATYQVIHSLIGDAIYAAALMPRRQAIHRAIGRALARRGDLSEAASHYALSASPGDGEAIDILIAALHQRHQQESPLEIMPLLESLLSLLHEGDRRWVGVLDAMKWDAEWLLDYWAYITPEVGLRVMRNVQKALVDSDGPVRRAVALLRIAAYSGWDLAQSTMSATAGHEALAIFEAAGHQRLALMARLWLAWIAGISGDLAQMERQAIQVIELAGRQGDRTLSLHGHEAICWALVRRGRFAEAQEALVRAIELAGQLGNQMHVVSGLFSLAYVRSLAGDIQGVESTLQQARELRPDATDAVLMAGIRLLSGDALTAFNAIRREVSAPDVPASARQAWRLIYAVIAAARTGRFEEAHAWLPATTPYAGRVGYGWDWFRQWAQGCLDREEGRLDEGALALEQAATGLRNSGYLPAAAIVLADLTDLLAELNVVHPLRMAENALRDIARKVDSQPYRALATLASAQLSVVLAVKSPALRTTLNRTGARIAADLARAFHAMGYAGWEARALLLRGRALIATNRRLSSEAFEQVVKIAEGYGLRRLRDQALLHLQGLGRPGRRSYQALTGATSLSRRESQVVRLAIQGITAGDIGRRLHISKRTVETHLANVYTKLGIRSRIELIRKADDIH